MGSDFRLQLKVWGVRGSIPTPVRENLGYGGNTPCLEVRSASGQILIIDAGTGIRDLGNSLVEELGGQPMSLRVFLSHFHGDHIHGLPFFAPLNYAENEVTFYARPRSASLEEVLGAHIREPFFPVDFSSFVARKNPVDIGLEPLTLEDVTVRPFPLAHPQGATGYRIESQGATIVYASDHEHGDPELDDTLRELSRDADILIYDAQFTPEEYERHRGWGHSTWLEATRVAREAGVGQLILFHHSPFRDDESLDRVVGEAKSHFANTVAAREGSAFAL